MQSPEERRPEEGHGRKGMQGDDVELEQEEAQDLSVDDFMFFVRQRIG